MPNENPDPILDREPLRKLAPLFDSELLRKLADLRDLTRHRAKLISLPTKDPSALDVGSADLPEVFRKIASLHLEISASLKRNLADAADRETDLLREIASLEPELVASFKRDIAESRAKLERGYAGLLTEQTREYVTMAVEMWHGLAKMEALAEAVSEFEDEWLAENGVDFVEGNEPRFAFEHTLTELRESCDNIINPVISDGVGIVCWLQTELSKLRDGRQAALGEVEIADFSIRLLEASLPPASRYLVPLFKELLRVDRHRAALRARPSKEFLQAAGAEAEASIKGEEISLREIARRAKVSPTTIAKWQKSDDYRKLVAAMTRSA